MFYTTNSWPVCRAKLMVIALPPCCISPRNNFAQSFFLNRRRNQLRGLQWKWPNQTSLIILYILFCRRGRLLGVVTTVCFIGQRACRHTMIHNTHTHNTQYIIHTMMHIAHIYNTQYIIHTWCTIQSSSRWLWHYDERFGGGKDEPPSIKIV